MSSASSNAGVFGYIGRRLALLNAGLVVVLIATVGIAILLYARHTLLTQADDVLINQARVSSLEWATSLERAQPIPDQPVQESDEHDEDEEEDETDELIESGDVIALGFDRDGNLVANPRQLTVSGLPDDDAVTEALAGESGFRSATVADGHDVRIFTAPIREDDRIVGAVQVVRSTAQVEDAIRAIELAALIGALIGAIGALPTGLFLAKRALRPIDATFRRQQAFIADASHELRTPLAVIRANTEMVRRMPDATAAERDAELAVTLAEVDRMARMIDDLLVLARADANRLPTGTDLLDLGAVVQSAVEPMVPLANDGNLALQMRAEPDVLVAGDEDRLAQVVRILVSNAIAYTPAGGSIDVSVARAGGKAELRVTDTGVGMTEDQRNRVFERFYRGERSRSRGTGGVGLGLSIAQVIVSAHRGAMDIESQPGAGTTVRVRLPLAAEDVPERGGVAG